MKQGIQTDKQYEEIASFIIDEAYPFDVEPLSTILIGSRGYSLQGTNSDYDFLGIHLKDTHDCLEHPKYRTPDREVIVGKWDKDHNPLSPKDTGEHISLQSYEVWEFLDLLEKRSFQPYELLYMPEIHHNNTIERFFTLARACLTSQIGLTAKHYSESIINKRLDRKENVMVYYRLIQAIHYLVEQEFEWKAESLFDYMQQHIPEGIKILEQYKNQESRTSPITEPRRVVQEQKWLITELGKAYQHTKIQPTIPDKIFSELLKVVRQIRLSMI